MTPKTPFSPLTGGCRCGSVRFRAEVEPIITHCCHCRFCQKSSGSAFGVCTMIETDHLTILEGTPEPFQGPPGTHKLIRCPACQSTLWGHLAQLGDGIALVSLGSLDHGERLAPEAHYFTRSKHPWVVLPPELPAFTELGDPGKPSARARIESVLARDGGLHSIEDWASARPNG